MSLKLCIQYAFTVMDLPKIIFICWILYRLQAKTIRKGTLLN